MSAFIFIVFLLISILVICCSYFSSDIVVVPGIVVVYDILLEVDKVCSNFQNVHRCGFLKFSAIFCVQRFQILSNVSQVINEGNKFHIDCLLSCDY